MPKLNCTMATSKHHKLAIWAVTPNGAELIERLIAGLPNPDIYISQTLDVKGFSYNRFDKLSAAVKEKFDRYNGHIFIMATGIVVRVLAPLIQDKTRDPAVVVVDDLGKNAISLLSGHIGGANELTCEIAGIIQANPVITTATDVNRVPAIDVMAMENGLVIENPEAIKNVNMAFVKNEQIDLHDPFNFLEIKLLSLKTTAFQKLSYNIKDLSQSSDINNNPIVYIDDAVMDLPS